VPCSIFREARLVVEPLELSWSAGEGALALRGDRHPFAFAGAWSGGGVLLGSEPVHVAQIDDDPFALLDRQPDVSIDDAPACAVGGGWFGMLGFGLCHAVETLPPPPPARNPLPAFALAFYDHLLRLDADGQWWFEALWTKARGPALAARRRALMARRPEPRPYRAGPFSPASPGSAGLRAAIAECRQRIAAGELFQANLTFRLDGPFAGDPLDGYAAAIDTLGPRYGAYLAGPWGATIGLSPELFLRRRGQEVLTRPIKGTVERSEKPESARSALLASEKDRAEHVMIVDLVRNDLGRVCEYGSVCAEPQPAVEAHPGVWHLVTDIRGRLRDDVGHAQLLRATFPPGSVTGAPKIQALQVISELEGVARGAYTGAMGFASPVAGLELNVAIRTVEVRDGLASLGVGGGIVAASKADAELEEAFAKARPLIRGLGATLRRDTAADRDSTSLPARALDGTLLRPDPALGVLETVAVEDGEAIHLDLHLRRLERSLAELYDAPLPVGLAREVQATASRSSRRARLRIEAIPHRGGRIEIQLSLAGIAANAGAPVLLAPVLLPGGLGAHKWRDRRTLAALQERHGAMPLLVDCDGVVLEAASANVWVLEGETLLTPSADGRLLPGVTRGRLLALAGAQETEITLDRLDVADAVLLSSSIAGVRVVAGRLPDLAAARCLCAALAGDSASAAPARRSVARA
jgi:para-aminobenzoate synthetase/4-amino-4-deoxychorismate lyase